jgi:hypothetical protein
VEKEGRFCLIEEGVVGLLVGQQGHTTFAMTSDSSLAIASLFASASIWRSEVRTHCKACEPHQVHCATLEFLPSYSCDIFQLMRLSNQYVSSLSSNDIMVMALTYTSTLHSFRAEPVIINVISIHAHIIVIISSSDLRLPTRKR